MTCPKCQARLQPVQMFSGSSGLLRQNGGSASTEVNGVSCWRCGYWRDAEIVPVMGSVPLKSDEPKRVFDPVEKTATHFIVMKFYESIVVQRNAGASWYAVAQLLTQAGHRCQEKTLQKHFLMEQGKRCGDEKEQTA